KYSRKACQIGIDIRKRIDQRIPNASLAGEVNNIGKAAILKQTRNAGAVGEVQFHETESREFGETCASRLFERWIVIGIQIVEPDNLVAVAQKALRDVKANKASRACDKDRAVTHDRPLQIVLLMP